jgi:hypothetical protein
VAECLTTLQSNVQSRTASDYRVSYLNHIVRYWRTWQDVTGIVALKKIAEMRTIESTYIQPRETNFAVTLTPDVTVLPSDALEPREEGATVQRTFPTAPRGQMRFTGGGFRIQR